MGGNADTIDAGLGHMKFPESGIDICSDTLPWIFLVNLNQGGSVGQRQSEVAWKHPKKSLDKIACMVFLSVQMEFEMMIYWESSIHLAQTETGFRDSKLPRETGMPRPRCKIAIT